MSQEAASERKRLASTNSEDDEPDVDLMTLKASLKNGEKAQKQDANEEMDEDESAENVHPAPPPLKKSASSGSKRGGAKAVAPPIDYALLRFEFEERKGKWLRYADEHNAAVIKALKAKKDEAKLDVNGNKLVLNLSTMMQKNVDSGFERRVRGAIAGHVWQWEDEKGAWQSYPAAIALQLELAKNNAAAGDVQITAAGRKYSVDVHTMTQTNVETKVVRKVRREKSDGTTAGDASPAPYSAPVRSSGRRQAASKKKQSAAAAAVDSDEQEEAEPEDDEETPASEKKKKSAADKAASRKRGRKSTAETKKSESTVRTVIVKGRAPVDPECPHREKAHVYCEGRDVYDVMLNQTNVGNNNNKYYIIQLLEDDGQKRYSVWTHWGRVGYNGQSDLNFGKSGSLEEAKQHFCSKFHDKTRNEWSGRAKFKQVAGKYDLVKIDHTAEKNDDGDDSDDAAASSSKRPKKEHVEKPKAPLPESKLDERLQKLIELICDVKAMERAVVEMKYDADKAPLGRLTTAQLKAGYAALKKIEKCIEGGDFGDRLKEACNEFYTRIPHCFGMHQPPLIRDMSAVAAKMTLLEALGDIEIAIKTLAGETKDETVHPIDRHYAAMKCELKPLDAKDATFKLICDNVRNTHAPTHSQYTMKVVNIYECAKAGEKERFDDVGNRWLLWHGSRLTNWFGILSQGLKIAPPEAPLTGSMFGKGLYFADMSSKSANYCFATPTRTRGVLLLSECALGKCRELLAADPHADRLPAGYKSTKGIGTTQPDPTKNCVLPDGCTVPLGTPTPTPGVSGASLQYNEYVVYDLHQVKMRYLVEVDFNFK